MWKKITFKKKWFNPLYFILNDLLKDDSIRTILIYGGKSSAKTFSVCQLLLKEASVNSASSMSFRKESTTIPSTLENSFIAAVKATRLTNAFVIQDRKYRCEQMESEIIMKGLDDEEKAKGVEGFKYVLLDELNQFAEGEYDTFEMSLRGQKGQKIFGLWNPIDENSWVKTNLIDKIEWVETDYKLPCINSFVKRSANGMTILIKTTYEDNYWTNGSPDGTYGFVDHAIINRYAEMKVKNYNRYKVEVLGEWGKVEYGGEFYKQFNGSIHVGKTKYNPDLPLHLTIDFNVNPHVTYLVFQINGKKVMQVDEILLEHPRNTDMAACGEFIRKYQSHNAGLFIYGDPEGLKQSTADETFVRVKEKDYSKFSKIIIQLVQFKPVSRVNRSYPKVKLRGDFINTIFESNFEGIQILIGDNCKKTIIDFENGKEASDGTKHKEKYKNEITGVQCEKYHHCTDAFDYMICSAFPNEFSHYQIGGDKIILSSMIQGEKKEYNYKPTIKQSIGRNRY